MIFSMNLLWMFEDVLRIGHRLMVLLKKQTGEQNLLSCLPLDVIGFLHQFSGFNAVIFLIPDVINLLFV